MAKSRSRNNASESGTSEAEAKPIEQPDISSQQPAPDKAEQQEAKPVRVIWRDSRKSRPGKEGESRKKEPPQSVQIGMLKIDGLPDAATQRKGFEHEHARDLVANIQEYKFLKDKGE